MEDLTRSNNLKFKKDNFEVSAELFQLFNYSSKHLFSVKSIFSMFRLPYVWFFRSFGHELQTQTHWDTQTHEHERKQLIIRSLVPSIHSGAEEEESQFAEMRNSNHTHTATRTHKHKHLSHLFLSFDSVTFVSSRCNVNAFSNWIFMIAVIIIMISGRGARTEGIHSVRLVQHSLVQLVRLSFRSVPFPARFYLSSKSRSPSYTHSKYIYLLSVHFFCDNRVRFARFVSHSQRKQNMICRSPFDSACLVVVSFLQPLHSRRQSRENRCRLTHPSNARTQKVYVRCWCVWADIKTK